MNNDAWIRHVLWRFPALKIFSIVSRRNICTLLAIVIRLHKEAETAITRAEYLTTMGYFLLLLPMLTRHFLNP
jgi:hypothetical protein